MMCCFLTLGFNHQAHPNAYEQLTVLQIFLGCDVLLIGKPKKFQEMKERNGMMLFGELITSEFSMHGAYIALSVYILRI